ncbi:MAG: hypothetical protein HFI11_12925 [Lachnospiraceae bacterium]|nr:hypothetical protein [Lachnospiraceae bacterium]
MGSSRILRGEINGYASGRRIAGWEAAGYCWEGKADMLPDGGLPDGKQPDTAGREKRICFLAVNCLMRRI